MSDYRRQHPLLILFDTGRGLFSYISLAFVLAISLPDDLFGGFLGNLAVMAVLMMALSSVYSVLRWAFFSYRCEEGMVHIREGVLFKRERSIRRERVQSINVFSNVLQQAFGLATLQVKTAGVNTDAEVNLRALSKEEVENIRRHLSSISERVEGELEELPKSSRFLQGSDLWLAGATSGRFMVLFSVIALVFSQVFEYIPQSYLDMIVDTVSGVPLLMGLGIAAGLLLVSWALSTVTFAIQYARFTLRRYEDRLEMSWGVIKRNHVTVRMHRIQALVVHQGLFRQPFGLCTMLVEVAGGGAKEKERVSLLHPLVRRRELNDLINDILPEYRMPEEMNRLPARSLRRYLFRALAPVVVATASLIYAGLFLDLPYSWAALLLLIPAALLGRSRHSDARTSFDEGQLTLRFRNFSLYHVLIGRNHVQSLTLSANPFQRLGGLRTVSISLLSSPAGKSYRVKDVDEAEARAIRDWYSRPDNS